MEFKQRGGTRLLRLARGVRGRASLRAGGPAYARGGSSTTARPRRRSRRYQALLAAEEAPAEVGAGLGSGEPARLRVVGLAVEGADGVARDAVRRPASRCRSECSLAAQAGVPTARPFARVARPGRCAARREPGGSRRAGLGRRSRRAARCGSRSTVCRSGRASFSWASRSSDAEGSRRYHRVDRAAQFVGRAVRLGARGRCCFEGEWTLAGRGTKVGAAMSSRTCPDWPELTEIAPDLQFKHYTVAEARLPARCARPARGLPAWARWRSAPTSTRTSSTRCTRTRRWPRRSATRTGTRCASGRRAARATRHRP